MSTQRALRRLLRRMRMTIKQRRKALGMTQAQLARKANLSLPYIGRLETGRHDPKVGTLLKIAQALGVSVVDLLE